MIKGFDRRRKVGIRKEKEELLKKNHSITIGKILETNPFSSEAKDERNLELFHSKGFSKQIPGNACISKSEKKQYLYSVRGKSEKSKINTTND